MKLSCLLIRNAVNESSTELQNALQSVTNLWFVSEEEAMQFVREKDYGVIVIDGDTVSDLTDLVLSLRQNCKHNERIIVAFQLPSWKKTRQAIYAGATDCIAKTINREHILQLFRRINEVPESP